MADIAPSLLAADFSRLRDEVVALDMAGIQVLHLDSMDGMFVPNITFGPPVIKAVRRHTSMLFDVHLMIADPVRYLDDYVDAGAGILTVHYEACERPGDVLRLIRARGVRAGLSIKPETPVAAVEDLLGEADLVLVMSVNPGFGGQSFIPSALEKLETLSKLKTKHGYEYTVEVDGGINSGNIRQVAGAGAELIVTGSAFFKTDDYIERTKFFRSLLNG